METDRLIDLRSRDRKRISLVLLALLAGCNPFQNPFGPAKPDPMAGVAAAVGVTQAFVRADIDQYPSLGVPPVGLVAPQVESRLAQGPEPQPTPADAPTAPPEPPTADSSPAAAPNPVPPGDVPADSSSTATQAGGDVSLVSDETLAAFGAAIEAAAEKVQSSEQAEPPPLSEDLLCVYLFTQNDCAPCVPEKEACEKVRSKTGVTPLIINVDDSPMNAALAEAYKIGAYPTWVVLHPRSKNGNRQFYRYTGRDSNQRIPTLHKPLSANTSPPLVAGAMTGPTLKVIETLPFVAGKTLKLGDKVTLEVPKDLKWATSRSAKGAVVLSFSQRPRLTIHKFLDWKLALEGLEITPTAVTLQLDNMPDVVVLIDWNWP